MDKPICKIPGCPKSARSRGWCPAHYERWRLHGDPGPAELKTCKTPEEAFERRTEWQGDCLVWTGGLDSMGYGQFLVNRKTRKVHRYAWERVNGPIPKGREIDHACHNRRCANVQHLRLATHLENMANLSGPMITSTSGYRNVYRIGGKWMVQIQRRYRFHRYGPFATVEEAAETAAVKRAELFGAFAGRG